MVVWKENRKRGRLERRPNSYALRKLKFQIDYCHSKQKESATNNGCFICGTLFLIFMAKANN